MSEERVLSDVVWTPERGMEKPEVRGISWNNLLLTDDFYGSRWRTEAGVRITADTALQSTVVLACCRILAETIAAMPLNVHRRTPAGDEIAHDVPLHKVLSFAPNHWQTKFEFFEQIVMMLCLWGNSYTRIRSGRYGSVSELDNLHPINMDVERLENGRLRYSYSNPETGRIERYTQDQIMHCRWTAEADGIKGMVPIQIAREAIALARACEIHAAKFWANSARPGVVLQTDGTLSAEAAQQLRDNWERIHAGVGSAYRTAVLTGGLKANELGFTNEASQFVSSRAFQSEEIARVYRLPLHLVQGQSGGNLEVSGKEFVTYTLMPWLRRIESAISRSLIYDDDAFYARFDVRELLRGDSSSRAAYLSTMMSLGIYTLNDARRYEGLPPVGPDGDKHFISMNVQTLQDAIKPKPDPAAMMAAGGGSPPPAQGGVPSLPGAKVGKAPPEAPKGLEAEPKPADGYVDAVEVERKPAREPEEAVEVNSLSESRSTISIDFDRTFAANPRLWGEFAKQSAAGGNTVVMISRRPDTPADRKEIEDTLGGYAESFSKVLLVGGETQKADAAKAAGIKVDVWIDDSPHTIAAEGRAFCATGPGGGIDNSCGGRGGPLLAPDGGGGGGGSGASGGSSPDSPKPSKNEPLTPHNIPNTRISVTSDSAAFLTARNLSTRPENFSEIDPERLARSTKYLSADGMSGCLVDEDGDLGNVFNNGNTPRAGMDAVLTAIESGGAITLDCYDDFLPDRYAKVGFVAVAKLPFVDEYAPPNWDYEAKGRPDVIVMAYRGGDRKTIRSRVGSFPPYEKLPDDRYTTDFDAAKRTARLQAEPDRRAARAVRPDRQGRGRVGRVRETRSPQGPDRVHQQFVEVRRLIAEASGISGNSIEHRLASLGKAFAVYDHTSDTLVVSDSLDKRAVDAFARAADTGWVSQANPILHELAHRSHAQADKNSYECSEFISLSDEQRSIAEKEVSRYSATNAREFVAEVIAGSWAGRKYGQEILDLFGVLTDGKVPLA